LKEEYTIDKLIKCFDEQFRQYVKEEAQRDIAYPDRIKYDFCICAALLSMCKEIRDIKDRLDFMDL
jgi:hypothetical protein